MSSQLFALILNNSLIGYADDVNTIKIASAALGKAIVVKACVAGYKPVTPTPQLIAKCLAISTHTATTPAQGAEFADAYMTLDENAKVMASQPVRAAAKPGKYGFKDEPGKEYTFSAAKRHAQSVGKGFKRIG